MSSSVDERIVVTGIGRASPNGNSLGEFRDSLLGGRSGVVAYETRYMGDVPVSYTHLTLPTNREV